MSKYSFITSVEPRFCETDALGHISNTVLPIWFEDARKPLFKAIHPSMTITDWPLIVARISINYLGQIFVSDLIEITTKVSNVGNKSFTVHQSAYQRGEQVADGETVIVYFDYKEQKTISIPDEARAFLTSVCKI